MLLALGACDLPNPAASERRPVPGREPLAAEYAVIGAHHVPLPVFDGRAGYLDSEWVDTGIRIRESGRVRFTARGGITLEQNPAYLGICGRFCSTEYAGRTISPAGIGSPLLYRPLEVMIRIRTESGEYHPISLGNVTDEFHVAFAMRLVPAGTVEVKRNGMGFGAFRQDEFGTVWQPGYLLRGMPATLTVEYRFLTPQPRLTFACTGDRGANRVTRGEEIACRIGKADSAAPGTVTVNVWSFNGTERRDGDLLSPEWKGVMVKAGTVRVNARLGTHPEETLAATLDVEDRDWTGKAPHLEIETVDNGDEPRLLLRSSIVWAHDLGAINFFAAKDRSRSPTDPIGLVGSGPNSDLYYFKDLTFYAYGPVVLNRDALRRGSRFYLAQEPDRAGSASGSNLGSNWCDQSYVVSGLEGAVLAHERKHAEVYQAVRTRELTETIRRLEGVTDSASADMYDDYISQVQRSALWLAAVLVALAGPVAAQENGGEPAAAKHRSDCRLASQVLTAGHPRTKQAWAGAVIETCPNEGPPIIASRWVTLGADTFAVAELLAQSSRLADMRIYEQARLTVSDRSRPDVVRVGAMFVLARYVDPYNAVWFNEVAPPEGPVGYVRIPLGSALHSASITGSMPLVGPVRERVLALLDEVAARREAEPRSVWYAASALARRIRGR